MNTIHTYTKQGKLAATIALILISLFVILVVLLHFLRTELSPLVWAISDYATGKYGFLLTTAVIALSAGLTSMTVAGFRSRNQSVLTQGELVMLGISSFSMLLSGIFPIEKTIMTAISMVHIIASFLFSLLIMTIMLKSSIRLQRNGMLHGKNKLLLWIAISSPILFIVWLGVFLPLGLSGLGQRIDTLSWVSWLMLLGNGIRDNAFGKSNEQ